MKVAAAGFNFSLLRFATAVLLTLTQLIAISPTVDANEWRKEMLNIANKYRAERNIAPLKLCRELNNAAQKYANYMATENFFSHRGKDGSSFDERITKAGYLWRKSATGGYVGENIAAGNKSVTSVMKSWKNSSAHYKNLINGNFTDVGFGLATTTRKEYPTYWVQNFGSGGRCSP